MNGRRRGTTVRRWTVATASALAITAAASFALAGGVDTVLLANGGRVRGVVMEDDVNGVSVQLADGTVRKLKRAEVRRIDYASTAPVEAPSAPLDASRDPGRTETSAPAPAYSYPAMAAGPGADETAAAPHRRSKGLMVLGIVLMPVGAATAAVGGVAYALGSKTYATTETCANDYQTGAPITCNTTRGGDDTLETAGIAMLIGGGAVAVTGLVFTLVGASKKRDAPDAALTPRLAVAASPSAISLRGSF